MVREANIIHVEPDSELGRLLDQVDGTPLLLEKDGVHYILSREDEARPAMSDAEYQRILDETIGSWSDVDAEALIDYIYRGREEGTRPADRP